MARPRIEIEREDDGRWIAEILDLPGALAYGHSPEEAIQRVEELRRQISPLAVNVTNSIKPTCTFEKILFFSENCLQTCG